MPLTVLSVAFPFAPVGPRCVGGAEQVLTALDQAFTARGDHSIVIACEGSQATGQLYEVPLPRSATLAGPDHIWARKRVQAAIDQVVGSHFVDVIHLHGLDFAEYTLPRDKVVVATLHLPISWYGESLQSANAGRASLCCVSHTQRKTCPAALGRVSVVENGVEIPTGPVNHHREEFALVIGRICPEKNAHEALEAGTRAGIPVYLAGQAFPYSDHQRYFETRLQPLFSNAAAPVHHRFLGPLGATERNQLLRRAKCLLHPTLAPETSSLVAMEALAAGTPVIAYRSGALPELISDGVTGFLVDNVHEMAEAIHRVGSISPQVCRDEAIRRFSRETMVQNYLHLYQQLASDLTQGRSLCVSPSTATVLRSTGAASTACRLDSLVATRPRRDALPTPGWLLPWWASVRRWASAHSGIYRSGALWLACFRSISTQSRRWMPQAASSRDLHLRLP